MGDDVFCRKAASEALLSTRHFHVVADANPAVAGHILVVPRTHIDRLALMPPAWYRELSSLLDGLSSFLQKEYGNGGVAIIENGGGPAQRVPHMHLHLAPLDTGPLAGVPGMSIRGLDRLRHTVGDNPYTWIQVRPSDGSQRTQLLDAGGVQWAHMIDCLRAAEGWARDLSGIWQRPAVPASDRLRLAAGLGRLSVPGREVA